PRHPYTERLLRCDPAGQSGRTRHLPTIPGEVPDLRVRPAGCIFAARCHRYEGICDTVPPEVGAGGHRARCHRVTP
ncbi:MAG: peptide ABC transporter ATP-binding protein, partial [Gammaproteobacteria bacterium]|nr:peptide ABC transporter ATP-binding protein [Gammaproteobacteria bacterium]